MELFVDVSSHGKSHLCMPESIYLWHFAHFLGRFPRCCRDGWVFEYLPVSTSFSQRRHGEHGYGEASGAHSTDTFPAMKTLSGGYGV